MIEHTHCDVESQSKVLGDLEEPLRLFQSLMESYDEDSRCDELVMNPRRAASYDREQWDCEI